jgi:hypothetical protein
MSETGPFKLFRLWLGRLLFTKGCGWLRWKLDERTDYSGGYSPPEGYTVAPPLRRIWETVKDRRYGYPDNGQETAWRYLYDQDRAGDLMSVAPWRRYGPLQGLFDR